MIKTNRLSKALRRKLIHRNVNPMKVFVVQTQQILLSYVTKSDTFISQCLGLLGRSSLEPSHGLWLIPCNSIHMLGMRFSIDALYLDHSNRIVRCVSNLKPNQLGPFDFKTHSILEMPAGTIEEQQVRLGQTLEFRD